MTQEGETTLLKELWGYKDVANSDATDTLLEHHSSNHAIKIEDGATVLYSLLYNLSPKELEVLCKYIAIAKQLG